MPDNRQQHPELPEMADEWPEEAMVAAVGYNPFSLPEAQDGREVTSTGAKDAAEIDATLFPDEPKKKSPRQRG